MSVKTFHPAKKGHFTNGSRQVIRAPGSRIVKNLGVHHRRILIGIPTLGVIRIEWDVHRRGQTVPINWQAGEINASHAPESVISMGYQVADAQNIICERAVLDRYEWVLLYEDDVLPPFDALLKLNTHIDKRTAPVISGLYFSKGNPTWPLTFRGRGNSAFRDYTIGDQVWCDGVPTGFLMIHGDLIRYLWEHSEDYKLPDGRKLKKIFEFPRRSWFDPEQDKYFSTMGTSDLHFCHRIMEERIFEKVYKGTPWARLSKARYPFLVDTSIYCKQIDLNGVMYPDQAQEILLPYGNMRKVSSRGQIFPVSGKRK